MRKTDQAGDVKNCYRRRNINGRRWRGRPWCNGSIEINGEQSLSMVQQTEPTPALDYDDNATPLNGGTVLFVEPMDQMTMGFSSDSKSKLSLMANVLQERRGLTTIWK